MRDRKDLEVILSRNNRVLHESIAIEVLLDIRDLLIEQNRVLKKER